VAYHHKIIIPLNYIYNTYVYICTSDNWCEIEILMQTWLIWLEHVSYFLRTLFFLARNNSNKDNMHIHRDWSLLIVVFLGLPEDHWSQRSNIPVDKTLFAGDQSMVALAIEREPGRWTIKIWSDHSLKMFLSSPQLWPEIPVVSHYVSPSMEWEPHLQPFTIGKGLELYI